MTQTDPVRPTVRELGLDRYQRTAWVTGRLVGALFSAGEVETMAPSPGERVNEACRVCGASGLRFLPFGYVHSGSEHYGAECLSCGSVFLYPMLSDDAIEGLYAEEYFTRCDESVGAHGNVPYTELLKETAKVRREAARKMDRQLVKLLDGRGALAEIGCGLGHFLKEMRDLGWKAWGLEVSEYASQKAREEFGLEVVTGSIGAEAIPPETFDACFLGDVLEHLPRPKDALRAVSKGLVRGGILAVAVPSTLNLLSARLGMALYGARGKFKIIRIPPYHLFEYRPGTLRRVLEESGYQVLEVKQSAVPIGRMGLRGTAVENVGKASLQVLAHATSRFFNCGGDRLLALARKP